MADVYYVHWNRGEAEERARRIERGGHSVRVGFEQNGGPGRAIRARPPEVVVIDLGRLPAHGRELAGWMRETRATRGLPIVFVGGAPEKVSVARRQFPDAEFAEWPRIRSAVRRALANPPPAGSSRRADPSGYSGTPLPKKLGLRANGVLMLLGAPDGIDATLGELPEGCTVRRQARGKANVIVLFVSTEAALRSRWPAARKALDAGGGLWVAWPKKTSGLESDLSQSVVQRVGLSAGLVDNKICAIDATWSAQRFMRRRR